MGKYETFALPKNSIPLIDSSLGNGSENSDEVIVFKTDTRQVFWPPLNDQGQTLNSSHHGSSAFVLL